MVLNTPGDTALVSVLVPILRQERPRGSYGSALADAYNPPSPGGPARVSGSALADADILTDPLPSVRLAGYALADAAHLTDSFSPSPSLLAPPGMDRSAAAEESSRRERPSQD